MSNEIDNEIDRLIKRDSDYKKAVAICRTCGRVVGDLRRRGMSEDDITDWLESVAEEFEKELEPISIHDPGVTVDVANRWQEIQDE